MAEPANRVLARRVQSFSFAASSLPSTRSIGGAPSRVASRTAAGLKVPVVMNRPLSARPTIAPRKFRTSLAETDPLYLLHWNST
jgi:hypothetical protein